MKINYIPEDIDSNGNPVAVRDQQDEQYIADLKQQFICGVVESMYVMNALGIKQFSAKVTGLPQNIEFYVNANQRRLE